MIIDLRYPGSKVPGDGLIHRRSRDYMEVGYVEAKSRGRVGIVAVEGEISKFHAEVKSRGRVGIVAVKEDNSMLRLNLEDG